MDPLRPVDHVDEGRLDAAPLDELVHDGEPVPHQAPLLHGQHAVVELRELPVDPLGLRLIDRDLGHRDDIRVGVVGDGSVVHPRAEDVVGRRGLSGDAHPRLADHDGAVDDAGVDRVVAHVVPLVQRGPQAPLLPAGEVVLALQRDLAAGLVPGAIVQHYHGPDRVQLVEPPPELRLLALHGQGGDLRQPLGQASDDANIASRYRHGSLPIPLDPECEPRP